jgi:hypothetical protein
LFNPSASPNNVRRNYSNLNGAIMMKSSPVKVVQICLDDTTRAALSAAAREQDRSASSIVRLALREYLRKPINITAAA